LYLYISNHFGGPGRAVVYCVCLDELYDLFPRYFEHRFILTLSYLRKSEVK